MYFETGFVELKSDTESRYNFASYGGRKVGVCVEMTVTTATEAAITFTTVIVTTVTGIDFSNSAAKSDFEKGFVTATTPSNSSFEYTISDSTEVKATFVFEKEKTAMAAGFMLQSPRFPELFMTQIAKRNSLLFAGGKMSKIRILVDRKRTSITVSENKVNNQTKVDNDDGDTNGDAPNDVDGISGNDSTDDDNKDDSGPVISAIEYEDDKGPSALQYVLYPEHLFMHIFLFPLSTHFSLAL